MNSPTTTRSTAVPSLIGGLLAALGATACCFGPLLLVTAGLGGAWVTSLRELEAYQPVFAALTLASIGFAFHQLYVRPRRCAPGEACAVPAVLKRQRVVFWFVVAIIAAMFAFPLYAPLLY